jgi:hypothetical protein
MKQVYEFHRRRLDFGYSGGVLLILQRLRRIDEMLKIQISLIVLPIVLLLVVSKEMHT